MIWQIVGINGRWRNKRNCLQRTVVTSTLARHLIRGKLEKSAISIAGTVTILERYRTSSRFARIATSGRVCRDIDASSSKDVTDVTHSFWLWPNSRRELSTAVALGMQSSSSRSSRCPPSFIATETVVWRIFNLQCAGRVPILSKGRERGKSFSSDYALYLNSFWVVTERKKKPRRD